MVQARNIDEYGLDPLTDPLFEAVDSSVNKEITVDESLQGNPQKVAFNQYGSSSKFQFILAANGLAHPSELVAGRLKIPLSVSQKKERKPRTVKL